jgi:hypothetical protein
VPRVYERKSLAERFWPKVQKSDGCWLWTGKGRQEFGYGVIGTDESGLSRNASRVLAAHRAAWKLTHGPIPKGMSVCHQCDNPRCVRPDHLFLGTQRDNIQDAARKGRMHRPVMRGEKNRNSRLTTADVIAIRSEREKGRTQQSIADQFGITQAQVSAIVLRKQWREL